MRYLNRYVKISLLYLFFNFNSSNFISFDLLRSDLVAKGDIKFAILYETTWRLVDSHPGWNLSDERNIKILTSDFEYLSKNYFQHPAYFRVNGCPFVFVYESKGFFGDINQITILKDMYDLYLVSDHGHPEADPKTTFRDAIWGNVAKRFDAIMDRWGYEHYSEADMKRWYGWCNINGIDFIPSATVGLSYKNAPWKFDVPEVPRKTELLKERIQLALKYVDPDMKILFIPEFNNFFENSYLEPSTQDGFRYLTTLKSYISH